MVSKQHLRAKYILAASIQKALLVSFFLGNSFAADDPEEHRDPSDTKRMDQTEIPSIVEDPIDDTELARKKQVGTELSTNNAEGVSPQPLQPRKKQAAQSIISDAAVSLLASDSSTQPQQSAVLVPSSIITPDEAFVGMSTLPNSIQFHIISFLPNTDKIIWRLMAKRYRDSLDSTFFGPVYDPSFRVRAYSSEISGRTIGAHILDLLGAAQSRVIIASDKCTNEELLDDLLTLHRRAAHPLEVRIVTGPDESTRQLMTLPKYSDIRWRPIASNADNSGKMHNKFIIIDDHVVVTGSPNLTYAAYNYNIESFVAIYHRFIARLYFRYYEYIICGKNKYDQTQDEYRRVAKMMQVFNTAPNNPIQVCLAPIYNIKSFIIGELNSTQSIDINMFLVSRASAPDNDIVANLLKAITAGTRVSVKVDGGQYDTMSYMRSALRDIARRAQTFTVSKRPQQWETRTKRITTKPQFHDKLVLIQQAGGVKKVFIGSAGFTDNVQDNLNLENMVLLKISSIYDMLLGHFNSIDASRGDLQVTKL